MKNAILPIVTAGTKDFNQISFGWLLTDWCNYDCSYCSSKGWLVDKFDRNKYRTALIVPFRLKNIDVDFTIDLAGGEPTVHPYLNQILKSLADIDACKSIVINTNLSRSLRYFKNLYKHDKIMISASYHVEHDNEDFVKKCIELKGDSFVVHINVVDEPEHWPTILKLIKVCKEHDINYAFNSLHSTDFKEINYTTECFETFNELNSQTKSRYRYEFEDGTVQLLSSFEVKQKNLHKFLGYKCTTLKYLIQFDGLIRRECNRETITAMFPKRKDFFKTITCPRTQGCDCDVMLNYYKESPNVYA